MSHLPVPAAANHLERMHFCVDAPDREELFALYFEADPVPPKKNLSKYKVGRGGQSWGGCAARRARALDTMQRQAGCRSSVPARMLM
jgi:hypothetical protein